MKTLSIIIFCVVSLIGTIGLSYALYPHASSTKVGESTKAKSMEEFDQEIDMGEDFGTMSVIDLMGYYLENPPAPTAAGAVEVPKRQFGGC